MLAAASKFNKTSQGDIIIAGIIVGKEIARGLFAERLAGGRYMIRELVACEQSYAKRLGCVDGGHGKFVASTVRGQKVAVGGSLLEAAKALQ